MSDNLICIKKHDADQDATWFKNNERKHISLWKWEYPRDSYAFK